MSNQYLIKLTLVIIHLAIIFTTTNTIANTNSIKCSVNFENIQEFANLSNATYQTKSSLRKSNFLKNYTLIQHGNIPEIEIFYLLATNENTKTQNIAVRGTFNVENSLVNISLKLLLDKHTGVRLHSGYLQAAQAIYAEIKPQIRAGYTINTTGHSLGGAIALILAMQLDNDNYKIGKVVTFGQPKITNISGANKYQHLEVTRIVTPKDLVPLVPILDIMEINDLDIYWHLGTEIILLPGNTYSILEGVNSMLRATKFTQQPLTEKNIENHQMKYYLSILNNKIPISELVPYKTSLNLFNLFNENE